MDPVPTLERENRTIVKDNYRGLGVSRLSSLSHGDMESYESLEGNKGLRESSRQWRPKCVVRFEKKSDCGRKDECICTVVENNPWQNRDRDYICGTGGGWNPGVDTSEGLRKPVRN